MNTRARWSVVISIALLCWAGGIALAGPGLWALLRLSSTHGRLMSVAGLPTADGRFELLVSFEFVAHTSEEFEDRFMGNQLANAAGAIVPNLVVDGQTLIKMQTAQADDLYHDLRVFFDASDPARSARIRLGADGSSGEVSFLLGVLLLIAPISVGISHWLGRTIERVSRRRHRDPHVS